MHPSLTDVAASQLLPDCTDAALHVHCPETKSYNGASSCQHATKMLSLEMLPEKETGSASAFMAVHSLVDENKSANIRELDSRSGWLVFDLCSEPLLTQIG